jgi:transposase InsO family protein
LALKLRYPDFGAKKLLCLMEEPISLRTANRVLSRHGYVCKPPKLSQEIQHFEKESANELWQMDFKGLKRRVRVYEALGILDDSTRFNLALDAVPDQSLSSVWSVLWDTFGQYGLPLAILSDNGPAFANNGTWRPSSMDALLMRLGIRSIHGRAYHPQTQGKIERFFGTLQRTLDEELYQPTLQQAQSTLSAFRDRYNWERPHEAIAMKMPGGIYTPSSKKRPDRLPEPTYAPQAAIRKTDELGFMSFKGNRYKMGRGLAKQPVGILQRESDGELIVVYASFTLGLLQEFAH